jgi:tetratricopeptide (TPR) repeat protein
MKDQQTTDQTFINQESEQTLSQYLRELNHKLDHQKPIKELTDEEIVYYLKLTKTLEKLSDLYFNQAKELNQQKKQIKQDRRTDTQTQQEILDLENQSGELLIKSSMLLNAAIAIRQKRELLYQTSELIQELSNLTTKISQIETYLLTEIIGITKQTLAEKQYDPNDQWEVKGQISQVKYKQSIIKLRQETKQKLKDLSKISDQIELKRAEAIKDISVFVSVEFKKFLKNQFEESIRICGTPPCHYSIILLGSIAKQTATPYSDIEFAILIEEKHKNNQQIKQYFRNLSKLLCLKINNLQESPIPQTWYHTSLDYAYNSGIGFDLGGKTPLNRKRDKDIYIDGRLSYPKDTEKYDLIVTPSEIMTYFDKKYFSIDKWLSFEISNVVCLMSNDNTLGESLLFNQYQQLLNNFQSQLDIITNRPNHQARSLMIMYEGIEQFGAKKVPSDLAKYDPNNLDNEEKEGALYQIKQDIYRLPDRLIEGLCTFYGIETGGKNSWELVEELFKETKQRPATINPEAKEQLQIMVSIAVELRLSHDLYHQGQLGMISVIGKLAEQDLNQKKILSIYQDFSEQQLKLLQRFYYTALPFHQKLNEFCLEFNIKLKKLEFEILEEKLSEFNNFIHSFFKAEKFFDDSNLIKAKISKRFLRYNEAERYLIDVENFLEEDIENLKKDFKKFDLIYLYGTILYKNGNHKKAIIFYQKCLEIKENIFGRNNPDVAAFLNNLGNIYSALGDYQRAIIYSREALEIMERVLGKNHPDIAAFLNNLGNCHGSLGNYLKAIEYHKKTLEIQKKIFGRNHFHISMSLNNLANDHNSLKDYPKAIEYLTESLAIQKKIFSKNHPNIAMSLNNLGNAHDCLGDYLKAIKYHKQALEIRERIFGRNNPEVAVSLNNLGITYGSLGDYSKAIEYLTEALEIREGIFGKNNPDIAISLNNIGNAHYFLENHQKAIECFKKASEIQPTIFDKNHPFYQIIIGNIKKSQFFLACNFLQYGNKEKAAKYFIEAGCPNLAAEENKNDLKEILLAELDEVYKSFDLITAIFLYQYLLVLFLEFKSEHHNLASLYHVAACKTQQIQGKSPQCKAREDNYLKLSEEHFKESIALQSTSSNNAKYANFLIKQQRSEEAIPYLLQAIELESDNGSLSYSKLERPILDNNLQQILDTSPNQEIIIEASFFVYYLLINVCYNNFNEATRLCLEFATKVESKLKQSSISYILLAKTFEIIGKTDEALACNIKAEELKIQKTQITQQELKSYQHPTETPLQLSYQISYQDNEDYNIKLKLITSYGGKLLENNQSLNNSGNLIVKIKSEILKKI